MTLKQMIDFKPSENDMLNLNLDEIVYLKIIIIGENLESNHKDLRILLNPKYLEELKKCIKNLNKSIFYDFNHNQKTITIFDLKSKENYFFIHSLFEDILNSYQFYGDISITFFTHDNKEFILSDFNGIVKTEKIKPSI